MIEIKQTTEMLEVSLKNIEDQLAYLHPKSTEYKKLLKRAKQLHKQLQG